MKNALLRVSLSNPEKHMIHSNRSYSRPDETSLLTSKYSKIVHE